MDRLHVLLRIKHLTESVFTEATLQQIKFELKLEDQDEAESLANKVRTSPQEEEAKDSTPETDMQEILQLVNFQLVV